MKTKSALLPLLFLGALIVSAAGTAARPAASTIETNRDKLIMIALQGKVAPATPPSSYLTTWDGKAKMAVGMGGINYNLRLGDPVFGWAGGERATMGLSAVGTGTDGQKTAWLQFASIGNEARVLDGAAKGEKGRVIGKSGGTLLLHFPAAVLDKLAVDDGLQVKAVGAGLTVKGFEDVFIHGLAPDVLEKMVAGVDGGKIQVRVVKAIPAEIVGQGAGGSSLSGVWNIQTCYAPDIKAHHLDELRFGDIVFLQDIQTDYGKGYYRGGGTVGIVCTGPSDQSGMGIGVTPVLSSRAGKIAPRLDADANLGVLLGFADAGAIKPAVSSGEAAPASPAKSASSAAPAGLRTNKEKLIVTAVEGVVQPASTGGYDVTYDGRPKLDLGMASINYTVSVGDPAYGWADADHVEPDVTLQGRDKPSPSECALAILACIGNKARVVSGDAQGGEGYYIGRHAGADDKVWFPPDVRDKLALNDRVQVVARGVGLKIEGFEDVRVNKIDPGLLEKLGIVVRNGKLVVPVAMEVPGMIMGSGIGAWLLECVDYDIQTTDPATVEKYGLKKIRLGDLVAIRDHYDAYGRGRYAGAVTIGVCIHGWSDYSGHGPGINPILSALPGRIETTPDPQANIAYALGIKKEN